MTIEHNRFIELLDRQLMFQLPGSLYSIRINAGRVHVSSGSYYIPDVWVVPEEAVERKLGEAPRRLEVYDELMPLVVEVWSPSTGDYDVEEKLPEYQRRGDLEIWSIHPYDKTLTRWIRRDDRSYEMTVIDRGAFHPSALPGVTIEFEKLSE
jgi:Uma2 family endonuclease